MNDLIKLEIGPDVTKSPKKMAEMIVELANDIHDCEKDLKEIKNRGFWRRIISSNTKDLADAMIKQNDGITLFVRIMHSLIFFHMNDLAVLNKIQSELNKTAAGRKSDVKRYVDLAKELIADTRQAAEDNNEKIGAVKKHLDEIAAKLILHAKREEQNALLIAEMKYDMENKDEVDQKQTTQILNLERLCINLGDEIQSITGRFAHTRHRTMRALAFHKRRLKYYKYWLIFLSISCVLLIIALLWCLFQILAIKP